MNRLINLRPIIISLILLIWAGAALEPVQAQWPPFNLRLTPAHEGGRITYRITQLRSEVDWLISDVHLKIPLPEGVRFVEAVADAPVQASFDGQEVSFFFLGLDPPVKNAYFVVEVTDPGQTVVTVQPWLSWEGQFPGNYSHEPITVDTTQPAEFLDWAGPSRTTVQLEMDVTAAAGVITYKIYPQKIRRIRVWDLNINLPLPEGTTFLSAEAPPAFERHFAGGEVHFFTLELPAETTIDEPLIVNLSAEGIITPALTTRAWASWKNAGRQAGLTVSAEEQTVTGDLVIQPQAAQYALSDQVGDVPFADYDLTNVSLQSSETTLEVVFHTAGQLCGIGEPLDFRLFIDADCQATTGQARQALGADYEIRYDLANNRTQVRAWQADQADWIRVEAAGNSFVGRQSVIVQVPFNALNNQRQFCWASRSKNQSTRFVPYLPDDWLPDNNGGRLIQYQPATPAPSALVSMADQLTAGTAATAPWAACPVGASQAAVSAAPVATEPGGSLAVPLYNGSSYNIHLFSVPGAGEITQIANARQPNFWSDGQRLLFRRPEDNGGIYEYNLTDRTEKLVSERLNHQHPFYDPGGNRLVYDNRDLVIGADGNQHSFLFTQCSLFPPHTETQQRCQDVLRFGILAPAGQMGEIQGSHPVWTASDRIAYTGCNSWTGFSQCGIYTVPSVSTKGFSNGFIPTLLTDHPSDTPSDTQGELIVFSSQREGNWETYLIKLDGSGLLNLSNSPEAQDGLPTISPDGYWVAFLSNRTGQWAIWATSVDGSQTRHLFDLPPDHQVGQNEQDWLNERLDWGP